MIKNLQPRLFEVGKIKIGGLGAKKKGASGKEYRVPKKYDHFVVTTNMRDDKGDLIKDAEIMKQLGDKPKELSIRLMFDDIDLNFQTSYVSYEGKTNFCRGDGETASRLQPDETRKTIECNTETCPIMLKGNCKISGILSCLLPQATRLGGAYKFRTHSFHTVSNILGALSWLKLRTGGTLANLPLKLELVEKQTEKHGKVKVVGIVFDGNIDKLNEAILLEQTHRNSGKIDIKKLEKEALTSGLLEDADEPEEVEAEYFAPKEKGTSPEKAKADIEKKEVDTGYEESLF